MRDDFPKPVKEILAKRVAQKCSNPSCRRPTSGPQDEPTKSINIGVAAHITAASLGGPRFDPEMTPSQRSSFENGIWLCQNCAKLIDSDPSRYNTAVVRAWKIDAERLASRALEGSMYPKEDQVKDDAACVKVMAATLLKAGKLSWGMPDFIAPLALKEHMLQDDQTPISIDASELISAINAGENTVLFGAGGLGKTTILLDLCRSCLDSGTRIPLYVEATVWARTNLNLFDFLVALPSAQANGVTSANISNLADLGQLVIMLNGWNEMLSVHKLICRESLIQLFAAHQDITFVITSRSVNDVPVPQPARHFEIQGLTWHGQSNVIGSELASDSGAALLELLSKNTQLRHSARSPLILKGLIAQAKKGIVASSSIFDLLAASIKAFEEDQQRNLILSDEPIYGQHHRYLKELACLLTGKFTTNCFIEDAIRAIHRTSAQLAQEQLIGFLPQPKAVLDILVNHHLLHIENNVLRFAHQRFQEYFAADVLIQECLTDDVTPRFLDSALNLPVWYESVVLTAGKLKEKIVPVKARVKMMKAATEIDVGLACDLAGICSFNKEDDPELYGYILDRVNNFAASPLEEISNFGKTLQIASRFQTFAEDLWPLLESEDQQIRLQTYRLNSSGLLLSQLGTDVDQRIAKWPAKRRKEFIFEIAGNPDNYEYIVNLAKNEPDHEVRAASISALFWNFPASQVAMKSWLNAPIEVQTDDRVLSDILYAIEAGFTNDEMIKHLQTIALNDQSDSTKLKLALAFPDKIGPYVLDVIFEYLVKLERHGNADSLIAIAQANDPQRLHKLALNFALNERIEPQWVSDYLHKASAETKTAIFDEALTVLGGQNFKNLYGHTLGPLADSNQINHGVDCWLENENNKGKMPQVERDRHDKLGELLQHTSEKHLMRVVMERGLTATYNESTQLLDLLWRRIGKEDRIDGTTYRWLPTTEEVRKLVEIFSPKVETEEVPQDTVRVRLCSIAGAVDPDEFWPFLLETCRRHLDAWSIYREKKKQTTNKATLRQLQNPYFGLYLISAIETLGPKAIPGLLELMAHPCAMDLIPEAIARVAVKPWVNERGGHLFSLDDDIQEGVKRQKLGCQLKQPDSAFQRWTDDAANSLGLKLKELVEDYEGRRATKKEWDARDAREAEYRVGRLTSIVARLPSPGIVESISSAIASGLMDVYNTVGALRGLLRQGGEISDASIVRQVESLYDRIASEKWHDNSLRYNMSELSELLFRIEPASLLNKSKSHYLDLWQKFNYPNEIIRRLSTVHSKAAWSGLLELGREFEKSGRDTESYVYSLFSALTPSLLKEFFALIANGKLFAWCRSGWTLKQLAPKLANVLNETPDQVQTFIDICWEAKHTWADELVGYTLTHLKNFENLRQSYLIKALDDGRAADPNKPVYRMLSGLFIAEIPLGNSTYEIVPQANDKIRLEIYKRAKGRGAIAEGCRSLLATIECIRREKDRPDDEKRHPASDEGIAWTDVLLSH